MAEIDSRPDTYEHIYHVQRYLLHCLAALQLRALQHDRSKLVSPEKDAYDGLAERLRAHEYGSEDYRAVLREIKPAIKHHYEGNPHHPEHWPNGIRDMSLVDLIEMLCDWAGAAQRQAQKDGKRGAAALYDSMEHNQKRFEFSDELKQIFLNTLPLLEDADSETALLA